MSWTDLPASFTFFFLPVRICPSVYLAPFFKEQQIYSLYIMWTLLINIHVVNG